MRTRGRTSVRRASTDIVERPRLLERLDGAGPLTIIRAPTGFGKTTLLRDWVDRRVHDSAVAWVGLDNDSPVPCSAHRFWLAVAQALTASGVPASDPSHYETICAGLRDRREPLVVVVDGYENVADEGVDQQLANLARECPAIRIVVCTRSFRRIHDEQTEYGSVVIRAPHLLFTREETQSLTSQLSLGLTPARVEQLQQRTAGWPALTRCAALVLGDDTHAPQDRVLITRAVAAYMCEHVLPTLVESLDTSWLFALAVPEELTVPAAEFVTESPQARDLLEELRVHGLLFLEEENGKHVYRWPPAARDALREEYELMQEACSHALHRRLAHWYRDRRQPQHAIAHAQWIGDWELACVTVESGWLELVRNHPRLLEEVFSHVSLESLSGLPRTRLVGELLLGIPGGMQGSSPPPSHYDDALAAMEASTNSRDSLDIGLALLMVVRRSGDVVRAGALAEQLATRCQRARMVNAAEVADLVPSILRHIGMTRQTLGRLKWADEAFAAAYRIAPASPYPSLAANAAGNIALHAALNGDVLNARTWLQRASDAGDSTTWLAPMERQAGGIARLLVALEDLDKNAAQAAYEDLTKNTIYVDELLAFAAYAQAQYALIWGDKLATLQQVRHWRSTQPERLGPDSFARVLLDAAEADLLLALSSSGDAQRVLDASTSSHPVLTAARARLTLLMGRTDEVAVLASSGIRSTEASLRTRVDLLLLQAVAAHETRDYEKARSTFGEAVRVGGGTDGCLRSFALVPRRTLESLSIRAGLGSHLVTAMPADVAPDIYPAAVAHAQLSEREQLVLDHLACGATIKQISSELHVSTNTVKSQVRSIYRKLGATSRTTALVTAHHQNLLS